MVASILMRYLAAPIAWLGAIERNTWLFFLAQGVAMTTLNVNIIITALAGSQVAPLPWLSTLPLSMLFISSMTTTIPASLLMGKIGRKPVFGLGIMLIAAGMAGQGAALIIGSFPAFIVSSMLVGCAHGITQYYRYAAADSVPESRKPVVVSLVLAGGLIAAFAGATVVTSTIGLIDGAIYASCFFAAALLQCLALPIIMSLRTPPVQKVRTGGRPLGHFFRTPRYIAGVAAAALGFSVMTLLMTAAPLQIVHVSHLTDTDNAHIIQWHVIAMFAPSFFTGYFIKRFGADAIIITGLVLYIMAVVLLLNGTSFAHYFLVLFLVGLGWNALYVTGSSVIASVADPIERPKVQGVSDFIITTAIAIASLSAGGLHYLIGWEVLGVGALIPVGIIGALTIWVMLRDRYSAA